MKKLLSLFLVFTLLLSFGTAFAAEKEISVYLDGEKLTFDVLPEIMNGRTMVPMRKIFEEMGAEVLWNGTRRTITATCPSLKIGMEIDSDVMTVNSKKVTLDQAAVIRDSRTLVPLRAVAQAFAAEVDWDGEERRVDIYSKYPEAEDKSLEITLGENYDRNYFEFDTDIDAGASFSVTVKDNKIIFRGENALFYTASIMVWEGNSGHNMQGATWNTDDIFHKSDFEVVASCRELGGEKAYLEAQAWILSGKLDGNSSYAGKKFTVDKKGGEYVIVEEESPVYQHNKKFVSEWVNPVGYIEDVTDQGIIALSNEICKDAKDDYDKVRKIHDWVAENIYYDFDAFYMNTKTEYTAADVLKSRKSVCEGYANVVCALVSAQGIPCRKVTGYALGIGTSEEWTERDAARTNANHAWNRAYVNNRWVNIDATWDSQNHYVGGDFKKEAIRSTYFDITDLAFSNTHKYLK